MGRLASPGRNTVVLLHYVLCPVFLVQILLLEHVFTFIDILLLILTLVLAICDGIHS